MSKPGPVKLLVNFEVIYAEHQLMAATLGLLQHKLRVQGGPVVASDRILRRVEELQKLASGLRESKTWLRAIALQHPETKGLVNEALSELKEYESP